MKEKYPNHSQIAKFKFVLLFVFFPFESNSHHIIADQCDDNKKKEILAVYTEGSNERDSVHVDCSITLTETDNITKRLVFRGSDSSNVVFDCRSATINGGGIFRDNNVLIKSNRQEVEIDGERQFNYERPEHIIIRNCNITGSIKVGDMHEEELREASKLIDFTTSVRNNAPRDIEFDNIKIKTIGDTAIYLYPGVSQVTFKNSYLSGETKNPVIYLDHETHKNTIKNNHFDVKTTEREIISIDGSSHNNIINNFFKKGLNNGGIYLYRNCGEKGISRHATPSNNLIINNRFYYNRYRGPKPSVYVGSRNGKTRKGNDGDCRKDDGNKFGSGISDFDYARQNIIMQNQVYKRSIDEMIKVRNEPLNSPNYIGFNLTVSEDTVFQNRLAGCFVPQGIGKSFIEHGETVKIVNSRSGTTCFSKEFSCNNGRLQKSLLLSISELVPGYSCQLSKINFEAKAIGNNDGTEQLVSCPSNEKIIGAYAVCDLELGTALDDLFVVHNIPDNYVIVHKASDNVTHGNCYIGNNPLRSGNSLMTGRRWIAGINGKEAVMIGCKEHDHNGGDCQIKGALYCGKVVRQGMSRG